MNYQIKSAEDLLENASLNTSPAIQRSTVVTQSKESPPVQKLKPAVHEHIEVDDGLDIPPDEVAPSVMVD